MTNIFKKYLDNSADCDTIKLELQDTLEFEDIFTLCDHADLNDATILSEQLNKSITVESMKQELFDLIRNIWDAAYSYGYHDAQADDGFTLEEQE